MKNIKIVPICIALLLTLWGSIQTNAQDLTPKTGAIDTTYPSRQVMEVSSRIALLYGADEGVVRSFVQAAIKLERRSGIAAPIVIAIAIHESSFTSPLFAFSGNPFGIKASQPWDGPSYAKWHDGEETFFRVYDSAEAAVTDFGDFINSRTWYADARNCSLDDYTCVLNGLKKTAAEPGYSMNPYWDEAILGIIDKLDLRMLPVR